MKTMKMKAAQNIDKARMSQESLLKMAERHRTAIFATAYRSRLLSNFGFYLGHVIRDLATRTHHPTELIDMEKNLEAIEAALVHLWVLLPYNDILTLPDRLPNDQISRLNAVYQQSHRLQRHLRLAYIRAA